MHARLVYAAAQRAHITINLGVHSIVDIDAPQQFCVVDPQADRIGQWMLQKGASVRHDVGVLGLQYRFDASTV